VLLLRRLRRRLLCRRGRRGRRVAGRLLLHGRLAEAGLPGVTRVTGVTRVRLLLAVAGLRLLLHGLTVLYGLTGLAGLLPVPRGRAETGRGAHPPATTLRSCWKAV
jgi:hypothetical protein